MIRHFKRFFVSGDLKHIPTFLPAIDCAASPKPIESPTAAAETVDVYSSIHIMNNIIQSVDFL